MAKNNNLHNAKRQKNDEFYTTRATVELELNHYKEHFRGKVVYCNCDDPIESEFTRYFVHKFEDWGLKKLISTGYKESGHGVMYVYEGDKNGNLVPDRSEWKITELQGNGDFKSEECVELLKQADIVVSNPPFSLFREYVAQLIEYGKEFLIIGNKNAITYKEIFPLIKENKLWLGISFPNEFILPNGEITKTVSGLCRWFTNLTHVKRNKPLDLVQKYDPRYYPKYENYDCIECSKVMDIPVGYDGVIGIPITFLDKYCPNQFRIIGIACGNSWANYKDILKLLNFNPNMKYGGGLGSPILNGKATYARLLIQKI